ncbi:Mrp/NBP35 family ATP-binding protein [Acinetobacter sp. c3-l95]|uniref:Mrp/NBP35 family ATP-binding protein n=1 Tax=Acinetobacter sp. c3-l95 TaxID=3342804 RepID=UPI0035B959D3
MSWLNQLKNKIISSVDTNTDGNAVNIDHTAIDMQVIEQHLSQTRLAPNAQLLSERITQLQVDKNTLQLSFFVYDDETEHLQALYDELTAQLRPFGVETLNLHVNQKKKLKNNNLPPVVDANLSQQKLEKSAEQLAVEQQAIADQAPIKKTAPTQAEIAQHPHIKHVILVASGKGGVGKSTTTVNLALALKQLGLNVGVLDADIYGPSIPTMLGNEGQTPLVENGEFVPLEAYQMPVLSIGHLTGDAKTPIAWRGAKATGALMQMFNQSQWPMLDVLLIDMPPGTGDIQLTLAQRIAVAGAVIVTTPQHVALMDAQKGIELFQKVGINILGVIENMAVHICENCGHESEIFGHGGGEILAEDYHVPLLGQLPLNACIRKNADKGEPSVIAQDEAMPFYMAIAEKLKSQIELLPVKQDKQRIF